MITIKHIDNLADLFDLLTNQVLDSRVNRYRTSFFYRGLLNEKYKLETSLYRNCRERQNETENCILRNFSKYAAIEKPELTESRWSQLIIGQHHGLPTRLLDWTYSPLISLHFATSGEELSDMQKHNCTIWKIDIEELNSLLPQYYREKLKKENAFIFTTKMLEDLKIDLDKYDTDMGTESMILIEPPSIDQRIINQYSYFLIIPKQITDIEKFLNDKTNNTVKYIISKEIRWRIRDMLDSMNINERIIFPGLDGLAMWLKRHYYVK